MPMSPELVTGVLAALLLVLGVVVWQLRRIAGIFVKAAAQLNQIESLKAEIERLNGNRQDADRQAKSLAEEVARMRKGSFGAEIEVTVLSQEIERLEKARMADANQLESLRDEIERLERTNGELSERLRSHEAEQQALLNAQHNLTNDLRKANRREDQNQKLYMLMKGLLDGHELLRAARLAAESPPGKGASPGATAPRAVSAFKREALEKEPDAEEVPEAFAADEEHRRAARIARVMVADLLLYNRSLLEKDIGEETLRKLLGMQYRGARETFESRVSEHVRKQRHYLDVEFERALRRRARERSAQVERASAADHKSIEEGDRFAGDKEHQEAALVARVMVADLFLYNRDVIEEGLSEAELREFVDPQYRLARDVFESRVAVRVWKQRHYLDMEYERAIQMRTAERAGAASEVSAGEDNPAENDADPFAKDEAHQNAARIAKLMIADLFLVNWNLVEEGILDNRLRERLETPYQELRESFEFRVAERVLKQRHYLDMEYRRVLLEFEERGALVG